MNGDPQQGSVTLAALVAVLLLGLTALLTWQRRMDVSLKMIQDQARYMTAFHQAESALSWGLCQCWRGTREQCRQPPGEGFRACLQAGTASGSWLLRGESAVVPGLPAPVCLYRLVVGRPLAETGRAGAESGLVPVVDAEAPCHMLAPLPGGWLDYPPARRAQGVDRRGEVR